MQNSKSGTIRGRNTGRGKTALCRRPFIICEEWIMKFIHIADVHLGAKPDAGKAYSGTRPREIWETFEHIISVCEEEQTDLLLIAGDLFHRQPLLRELKEAEYLFSSLSHTKVVLIAGNHDHIRPDSHYRTFEWSDNVFPLFEKAPQFAEFPEFQTAVYGLSYYSREETEPLYDRFDAQKEQPYEILLAHGGDERHIPINWSRMEKSGFDYVALGHIHKPQAVRKNRIVYAGALEPIDRNDTGPHGYVSGEITDSGTEVRWIPCAQREYVHLEVPVDGNDTTGRIRDRIRMLSEDYGQQNMFRITLTGKRDPDIEFDTRHMDEIGNILEITDLTSPAYDFEEIYRKNRENLIGRYMERFAGCTEGSMEYEAMCEGVEALLANQKSEVSG